MPTLICRYPHRTVACRPSRLAIACQAQQQKPSFGSIAAAALAATSLLAGVRTMGLPEPGRGENGSTTHLIRPACEFPLTSDWLCQSPLLSVTEIHSPLAQSAQALSYNELQGLTYLQVSSRGTGEDFP